MGESGEVAKLPKSETVPQWANDLSRDIGQLRGDVDTIKDLMEETRKTLRGFNGTKGLTERVEGVEKAVNILISFYKNVGDDHFKELLETQAIKDANAVTFPWLTEKFAVPIIVASIVFVLFTACPAVFVLIYFLPQITQHFVVP